MNRKGITLAIQKTMTYAGEKEIIFGEKTYIMGILNVTPDSFSDGGDYIDVDKAVSHAKEMIEQGAHMIDVGGESTRPGFTEVSEEEEIRRVVPVIKRLSEESDTIISIDTTKASVARAALENGAHIINDIWGLQKDEDMIKVAAEFQVPVIIMHNHKGTDYQGDMITEMKGFLEKSIEIALEGGLLKENIILDPGVGFGKNDDQHKELMARLLEIRELGYPVLLGTSRKSMLGKILGVPPKDRVSGTVATTVMGIIQGVDIVRVHDVKENAEAAKVTDAIVRRPAMKSQA